MVQPERVLSSSRAFATHQERPSQLSQVLNGARGADAGEPGLNGEIQGLLAQFTAALTGLTAGLTRDAGGLARNAQRYQAADAAVARSFDQIRPSL